MPRTIRLRKGQRLSVVIDPEALDAVLEGAGKKIVADARREIQRGGRAGRYRDDGQNASVLGEAPHGQTGELEQSIYYKVGNDGSLRIGSTAEHGAFHEMGGRPFLRPAINTNIGAIAENIGDAIRLKIR